MLSGLKKRRNQRLEWEIGNVGSTEIKEERSESVWEIQRRRRSLVLPTSFSFFNLEPANQPPVRRNSLKGTFARATPDSIRKSGWPFHRLSRASVTTMEHGGALATTRKGERGSRLATNAEIQTLGLMCKRKWIIGVSIGGQSN